MIRSRKLRPAAVAAALAVLPVLALAQGAPRPAVGDVVGDTPEAVRAALVAKGCEVRKTDQEDGMLEVYALCGGERLEIYVSGGKIARVKADD